MEQSMTARQIVNEIASPERRVKILTEFWKSADAQTKALATAHLAKSMKFREETIRKASPEKKAEWLASRSGAAELEQAFEVALMAYHTRHARELMSAFLDEWQIPHEEGSIEVDDYEPPTREKVAAARAKLSERYDDESMRLYLASAGLIMGGSDPRWRDAMEGV